MDSRHGSGTECRLAVPSEKIDVSMIRSDLVCRQYCLCDAEKWWDLGGPQGSLADGFHTHTYLVIGSLTLEEQPVYRLRTKLQ